MKQLLPMLLTVVIFLPAAGAVLLMFVGKKDGSNAATVKQFALVVAAVEFIVSLPLAIYFRSTSAMQFETSRHWIDAAGLSVLYHVGLDGISLWLVLLTTLITPLTILASFT